MLGKDVDEMVMTNLDDLSLSRLCQINKKANSVCQDDLFWKRRIFNIFGYKTENILQSKMENETYRQFYTSKRFQEYKNKIFPLCLEIEKLPHGSQMVVDDFYNPRSGFVDIGYTRDEKGLNYLILKIVHSRLLGEGKLEEAEKLKKVIDDAREAIPDYRADQFTMNGYTFTEKDKKVFLKIINIPIGRPEILRSVARNTPAFVKSLRNPPESFKVISTIHQGFYTGKIPLDIKWDEICTFPYLLNELVYKK